MNLAISIGLIVAGILVHWAWLWGLHFYDGSGHRLYDDDIDERQVVSNIGAYRRRAEERMRRAAFRGRSE